MATDKRTIDQILAEWEAALAKVQAEIDTQDLDAKIAEANRELAPLLAQVQAELDATLPGLVAEAEAGIRAALARLQGTDGN